MRIAYVALNRSPETLMGGVGRKIETQMRIWRELGHTAELFLPAPALTLNPGRRASLSLGDIFLANLIRRELSRNRLIAEMVRRVEAFHPDIIFLRFARYAPPLKRLQQTAPLIVELNSNDVIESYHNGGVYGLVNRLTRGQLLGRAAGFVAVSGEIARMPAFSRFRKPIEVIANGVDFREFDPLLAPAHTTPRLAMVASPGLPWNGVDKLVALAQRCPDLTFDLVGYLEHDLSVPVPENVRLHGFVPPAEVRAVLKEADVVFGTLALHRKGMQEASPLKVREALAYGLPVILPYQDTDLAGKAFEFILEIPNDEENVITHTGEIRRFAYRMLGQRADREVLRGLIDQMAKEERRLAFFKRFL